MAATFLVNPRKLPKNASFTPEMAARHEIEKIPTPRAGQYGYRVRTIADSAKSARITLIATKYADLYAIGMEGVRDERPLVRVDGGGSGGDGYSATRLAALTWLAKAARAVGADTCALIEVAVVWGATATGLARELGVSDKTARARVIQALTALADWDEAPKKNIKKSNY